MSFFDWIKKSSESLRQVEEQIYNDKTKFIEIYKKNLELEREIQQRTEELSKANQTLLTLEHVWDMMNSSRPLSSVLEAIVKSLQGEFGYLYSCIIQKNLDKDGAFFSFKTYSHNIFLEKLNTIFKNDKNISINRMHFEMQGIIDKIIDKGDVTYLNNLETVLAELFPTVKKEEITKICEGNTTKALIMLPLKTTYDFYGCLCVFSPREEPKESELNFLSLFARQIELAITIANLFETVKKQAVTDPLTELFNRRFYEDAIAREASRALRLKQPFSLISLDLDDLKKINDTYGHSAGDIAISSISHVLAQNARSVDIACRIGGEEFSIILPGVDSKGAKVAAERIRASIEALKVEEVGKITASVGVATFVEQTVDVDELVEMADRAMYNAKKNGKNQVVMARANSVISWQEVAIEAFSEILERHKMPFDDKTAQMLVAKLQSKNSQKQSGASAKELLYSVVDTISKSYAPEQETGASKDKVYLATMVAKKLELAPSDIDKLKIAILLYDIGKTLVPEEILRKATPLTDDEKEKINLHPMLAAQEILKPISNVTDIIPVIEHHHENWDGTGYPNNKKGMEIPLISQIILIIDSYFAMIQERPWRKALTPDEAIEQIKENAGKKYSESLSKYFIEAVHESNLV